MSTLLGTPFMKLYQGIRGGIASILRGKPREVSEMVDKHGDKRIVKFEPRRRPIPSGINWLIDKATGGRSEKGKEKLGYDNFYHLWGNITLEDGTKLFTEKNERLYFKERHENSGSPSPFPVDVKDGLTLREMIDKTEKNLGKDKFFVYDPVHANCQRHLTGLMSSVGADDPRNRAWINQNVAEAIGEDTGNRWPSRLGKTITNVANLVGKGMENIGVKI